MAITEQQVREGVRVRVNMPRDLMHGHVGRIQRTDDEGKMYDEQDKEAWVVFHTPIAYTLGGETRFISDCWISLNNLDSEEGVGHV